MAVNLYDPRTMIKAVERVAKPKTFLRDTFFGRIETFPTKSVDIDFVKGNRKLAPFVHERIGGKTVPNTGYRTNTYKPTLIAPDVITTIDDIMKRVAGESLYGGLTPEQRGAQKMIQDLSKLEDQITRREEWMCAQTLFTGKIPIKGDSLDYEIDFEFENFDKKTGNSLWSNTESDPIKNLKDMRKNTQKKGLTSPDICIMADDVAEAFLNHEKVQKVLDIRRFELATIAPKELPNGATWIGRISELNMDIYTYNEWFLDDWTDPLKPEIKSLIPDGYVGVFSSEANFFMAYGAITLIDQKTEEFITIEATRVPDTWIEKKPARRFLQLNSRPMPAPVEVDSWFISKVL